MAQEPQQRTLHTQADGAIGGVRCSGTSALPKQGCILTVDCRQQGSIQTFLRAVLAVRHDAHAPCQSLVHWHCSESEATEDCVMM